VAGDTTAPTVEITSSESSPSFVNPAPITITFSEEVTGFAVGDITPGGVFGSVSDLATSDNVVFTANASVTGAGAGTIDIAAGVCQDLAGNSNEAATQFSITSGLLLFDQFTTDDAAPITTPRTCEPGPGTLVITDTADKVAIASSQLVFSGAGTGDPALWGPLQTLAAGLAVYGKLKSTPNAATYVDLGWDTDQSGAGIARFLYKPNNQTSSLYVNGEYGFVESGLLRDIFNEFAAIHRGGTSGILMLVKPNGGSWTLALPSSSDISTALYPFVSCPSYVSSNAYADDLKVVSLPSPFDGANGLATQVLAGSRSQGDAFTHTADCFVECTVTTLPASGQHEIQFRAQDASNYWQVTIDSSGALDLDEVVAGTPTQRGTAAGVIANGDRIVIRANGTAIQICEGTDGQTSRINYTSATNFATSTAGSLLTLGASGAVSNIIAWPRVITGAALTAINAAFP
jgi:hypothetical protein